MRHVSLAIVALIAVALAGCGGRKVPKSDFQSLVGDWEEYITQVQQTSDRMAELPKPKFLRKMTFNRDGTFTLQLTDLRGTAISGATATGKWTESGRVIEFEIVESNLTGEQEQYIPAYCDGVIVEDGQKVTTISNDYNFGALRKVN